MQKCLKLFLGLTLLGLVLMVVLMGLAVRTLSRPTAPMQVEQGTWLVLPVSGSFPDAPPEEPLPFPGMEDPVLTLATLRSTLQRAAADGRIKGLLLEINGLDSGWGATQELRDAIKTFRKSGKQVVTWMESAAEKEYYLASVADQVFLAPEGILLLNGLSVESTFFKGTFEKLGIQADFHAIGEYKSAPESFTRTSMSEPHREMLDAITGSLYQQLLVGIGEGRKLSAEEVAERIDRFDLSGPALVESRLIDGLQYADQVLAGLGSAGDAPPTLELGEYSKTLGVQSGGAPVAILYVRGEIASGESRPGGFSGSSTVGAETILDAMKELEAQDDLKGLVVRIDSPGGSAVAADLMWRAIMHFKERTKLPVIVSMGSMAASGGYWIATVGDKVVAWPGTLTGSIGVFFGKFTFQGLQEKIGARSEQVSRGKYADMFSTTRPFNEDEVKKVGTWLRITYDNFIDKVGKARGMSPAEVDAVARGRVWTGEQALERKLVDALGGFDTALELLRAQAGMEPQAELELRFFPSSGDLLDRLEARLSQLSSARLMAPLGVSARRALDVVSSLPDPATDWELVPQARLPWTLEFR